MIQRKYIKIAMLISFLASNLVLAGALISYFHATSNGEDVILEWQTTTETNLKEYVIERKTPNGDFADLAILASKGDNSFYSYIDESAYKTTDAFYIYRLRIIDNNQSATYSSEISVSHNVSSVKRTWGSIKALFR